MATYFSLFAQRKVSKRKGSPGCSLILRPQRFCYETPNNSLRSNRICRFCKTRCVLRARKWAKIRRENRATKEHHVLKKFFKSWCSFIPLPNSAGICAISKLLQFILKTIGYFCDPQQTTYLWLLITILVGSSEIIFQQLTHTKEQHDLKKFFISWCSFYFHQSVEIGFRRWRLTFLCLPKEK